MLNDQARGVLDPADQAALLAHARESLASERRRSVVDLPSGAAARMYCRPVGDGDAGRRRRRPRQAGPLRRARSARGRRSTPRMPLPGLVGSDPLWLRACRQVETAFRSGEWLVVAGEPGVGKLALLQAVQLRRSRRDWRSSTPRTAGTARVAAVGARRLAGRRHAW